MGDSALGFVGRALTRSDLEPVITHHGYGNPEARLWFLGLEESLGGVSAKKADEQLERRLTKLCHPVDTMLHYVDVVWHGRFPTTDTWKIMAKLAARLVDRHPRWLDDDLANRYVRARLATEGGDTFMLDYLPIPLPGSGGRWPYSTLPWSNRWDYQREVLATRTALFRDLIASFAPDVVFCYGSTFWKYEQFVRSRYYPYFPDLFPGTAFSSLLDRNTEEPYTEFQVGIWEDTQVILTPFFQDRPNRMTRDRLVRLGNGLIVVPSRR
jgi:hypothetical protein